ncbi:MAG: PEP-CTERM sorting domain-containing protein, partial [Verrucomicrobiaceae bacterium]
TATGFSLGHVIFHDPVLGAVIYDPIQGSGIRLRNADNTFTDLALFQIAGIPEFLDKVTISEEPPPVNGTLYMAGNGIPRESTLTQWDVNTSTTPDTWTQVPSRGDQSGYELLATTSAIRWGTNTVENNAPLPIIQQQPTVGINGGYGSVTAIKTDFDNVSGQAQGVAGDSGGGVFYKRGTWELTGIIVTRDYKDGQTGIGVDSAVFGNATYSANLSTYRQQIVNTIPEPSAAGLLITGAASLLSGRRRRK